MDDTQESPPSILVGVKKRRDDGLKTRLLTLITSKGMSQATFYKSLGLSKDYWYLISYGKVECPLYLKVKIATALGVDSATIWESPKQ